MKNYIYTGTSNLAFTHENADYVIYGRGPHLLPEKSPVVISNIAVGKLELVAEQTKVKNKNPES